MAIFECECNHLTEFAIAQESSNYILTSDIDDEDVDRTWWETIKYYWDGYTDFDAWHWWMYLTVAIYIICCCATCIVFMTNGSGSKKKKSKTNKKDYNKLPKTQTEL